MNRKVIIFGIALLVLLFIGCDNLAADNTTEEQLTNGSLSISIVESVSRSLLPGISMDPTEYVISGVGPDSAVFNETSTGTKTIENLAPGDWVVTATAKNSDAIAIGEGSASVTIAAGENKALSLSVKPFDGTGTLTANLEWTTGILTSPAVEAVLETNGVERELSFTITNNTASFSASDFSTGYHTLTLKLKDGTEEVGAAVETVRIVKNETTTGNFNFDVNNPTGGAIVTITPELNNPLDVSISGATSTKLTTAAQSLTASVSNYNDTMSYAWYVNGTKVGTASSYDFGTSYSAGQYRIDVIVYTADKTRAGSASQLIKVIDPSSETSLTVTLSGDDASLFKLALPVYGSVTSTSDEVQTSPAVWNLSFTNDTEDLLIRTFIDSNNNGLIDNNEISVITWVTVTKSVANTEIITLGKSTLDITVSGNTSIFTHPMLVHNGMHSGSSSSVVAGYVNTTIITYANTTASNGAYGNLRAFDDLNNNNLFDSGEPYISIEKPDNEFWEYSSTKTLSISLMATAPQILPDGEKIDFSTNANFYSPDDLLHYRFVFNTNQNKVVFVIPVGVGTDGAFITCYSCETDPPRSSSHSGDHLWNLCNLAYEDDQDMRSRVSNNYSQQLVEFKQNIKDIVSYLETTKGFTVYGKETLPSNW